MHADHTDSLQRPAWRKIAIGALLIGAAAALWRFTPLADYVTPQSLASWARVMRQSTWAPIALVLAFIPAAFIMFPLPLLILMAVLAFGPLAGLSYGMSGAAAAITATYCAGRMLRYETLRGPRAQAGRRARFISWPHDRGGLRGQHCARAAFRRARHHRRRHARELLAV